MKPIVLVSLLASALAAANGAAAAPLELCVGGNLPKDAVVPSSANPALTVSNCQ